MKKELHIVGIQADLVWEKPTKNLKFFEDRITALPTTTNLVVLPEMFSTGFTMQPNSVAEPMHGLSITWMKRLAQKFDFAITGSLIIEEDNKFYNRMVFVHPSGKIDHYDKKHSFTLAGEHKTYTSGKEIITIDYQGWKIRPLICYDLRFPVWSRNTENYDLLIYVANWPVTRVKAWDTLLKARAIENMSYTIGVNRIGKDANNNQYSGSSIIVDFLGEEQSILAENEIGTVTAVVNKEKQNKVREKLGFLEDKDAFKII